MTTLVGTIPKTEQEELVTTDQAAIILEVKTSTVWRWAKKGLFTYSYNGSKMKILLSEVLFFKKWRNEFLTTREAAEVLIVSYKEIKDFCKKGILTKIRVGGRGDYLFFKDDIYFLKEWRGSFVMIGEAAKILAAHHNTVIKWSKIGLLTPIRVGSRKDRVFLRSEVLVLKEENLANKFIKRKIYRVE